MSDHDPDTCTHLACDDCPPLDPHDHTCPVTLSTYDDDRVLECACSRERLVVTFDITGLAIGQVNDLVAALSAQAEAYDDDNPVDGIDLSRPDVPVLHVLIAPPSA